MKRVFAVFFVLTLCSSSVVAQVSLSPSINRSGSTTTGTAASDLFASNSAGLGAQWGPWLDTLIWTSSDLSPVLTGEDTGDTGYGSELAESYDQGPYRLALRVSGGIDGFGATLGVRTGILSGGTGLAYPMYRLMDLRVGYGIGLELGSFDMYTSADIGLRSLNYYSPEEEDADGALNMLASGLAPDWESEEFGPDLVVATGQILRFYPYVLPGTLRVGFSYRINTALLDEEEAIGSGSNDDDSSSTLGGFDAGASYSYSPFDIGGATLALDFRNVGNASDRELNISWDRRLGGYSFSLRPNASYRIRLFEVPEDSREDVDLWDRSYVEGGLTLGIQNIRFGGFIGMPGSILTAEARPPEGSRRILLGGINASMYF